jgi:hypothetical protein
MWGNLSCQGAVLAVHAKLLYHNLWCVILSQCELGIEAEFWEDEHVGPPQILPMVRPG